MIWHVSTKSKGLKSCLVVELIEIKKNQKDMKSIQFLVLDRVILVDIPVCFV